jgi:DNA-binding transcriptional regulator YiaG
MSNDAKRRYWQGKRGQGETVKWLRDRVGYAEAECLIWPFTRKVDGRGLFGFEGKHHQAHRFMCELVNGPPPTPAHDAAHSCGRGHDGCVHPKHLSWKTKTENQKDRRRHGTKSASSWRWRPKLTPADVIAIRKYKGPMTQAKMAEVYGVTDATIRDVKSGKSWKTIMVVPS